MSTTEEARRIGSVVRHRRQSLRMTTCQLGKRIGRSGSLVSNLERGKIVRNQTQVYAEVARVLGTTVEDLTTAPAVELAPGRKLIRLSNKERAAQDLPPIRTRKQLRRLRKPGIMRRIAIAIFGGAW